MQAGAEVVQFVIEKAPSVVTSVIENAPSVVTYVIENTSSPQIAAGAAVGAVTLYMCTPALLTLAGFSALGPAGLAASIMGPVTQAGSLFALAQSAGMGGSALAGFQCVAATIGTIGGAIGGAIAGRNE
jgi:hypothetical protein